MVKLSHINSTTSIPSTRLAIQYPCPRKFQDTGLRGGGGGHGETGILAQSEQWHLENWGHQSETR